MADAKQEFLGLLDRKVFDPTIDAKADDYPDSKMDELQDVKKQAEDTKRSYHQYGSAEHIKQMFRDDLRSPYGEKQTKMLHDLGLPAFPDVEDEFMRIAEKHDVS